MMIVIIKWDALLQYSDSLKSYPPPMGPKAVQIIKTYQSM